MLYLRTYPDPVLRKRARPLKSITGSEVEKLKEMLNIMYKSEGVGLAGPQVGWNVRVLTIDVAGNGKGERIFINPVISDSEGIEDDEEGCLSLPGIKSKVNRAKKVYVATYTLEGKKVEFEAEGLLARAWQHEIDHLNGVLFTDKLSAAERLNVRSKLESLEEFAEKEVVE